MPEFEVVITGMTCEDCGRHVTEALERAGAREVDVDWRGGRGRLDVDGLGEKELSGALEGSSYGIAGVTAVGTPADDPDRGSRDYELIVIGSGSAAFAAAIRARDLGRRVLMVERGVTGGTCVNVGCIPSKSLLADSERRNGLALTDAVARKDEVVAMLRQQKYVELIAEYGFEYREAEARLLDAHTVQVGGEAVSADAILIATGATPSAPPISGLEEVGYLTSTTALDLTEAPRRLVVVGANAVGLELGQMLGNFGSSVTFVDVADRIAPFEEPEVSEAMRAILEQDGYTVITGARIAEAALEDGEKVLRGEAGGGPLEIRADELLVATGRRPSTDGLGLAELGVETDSRGAVVVDAHQRTSVPSIYAAGDVTQQPQFVYVAAAGGAAAAQNALAGGDESLDMESLPRVTFTSPQIASAGLTERQARERGIDVEVSVLGHDAVPRAIVNYERQAVFKLVAERQSRRLVGASVLASGAGEAIHAAVLAIRAGMTVEDLARSWAPYLTMTEGLKLAAQTFGRDVAKLSCCAA